MGRHGYESMDLSHSHFMSALNEETVEWCELVLGTVSALFRYSKPQMTHEQAWSVYDAKATNWWGGLKIACNAVVPLLTPWIGIESRDQIGNFGGARTAESGSGRCRHIIVERGGHAALMGLSILCQTCTWLPLAVKAVFTGFLWAGASCLGDIHMSVGRFATHQDGHPGEETNALLTG